MPGNMNLPAWNLGGNVWLLDDLNSTPTSLSMNRMSAKGLSVPDDGSGDGSFSPALNGVTFMDTNALWLDIPNLTNGWSYSNLHNGTNYVYAILSKTNLPDATWNIET